MTEQTRQELIEKQNSLMKERNKLNDLQADCRDMGKWHNYEREKERLEDECESIRLILEEMGCCD